MIKLSKKNKPEEYFFVKNNLSETNKIIICVFCLLLELVLRSTINQFMITIVLIGVFYRFASIVLDPVYGFIIAFLTTKFSPLTSDSNLLFEIIAGISGWSVGFLYKYLDRFSWPQKKCIKLGASIFVSIFFSNYLNSTMLLFFECILFDCSILGKLFLLYIMFLGLFFVLFEIVINVVILFPMLNIYDKIADKNK